MKILLCTYNDKMELTPEIRRQIDYYNLDELFIRWKTSPASDQLLQGESGQYVQDRLRQAISGLPPFPYEAISAFVDAYRKSNMPRLAVLESIKVNDDLLVFAHLIKDARVHAAKTTHRVGINSRADIGPP